MTLATVIVKPQAIIVDDLHDLSGTLTGGIDVASYII